MTGSWSHGGAIHLMPAPNPWLPSYHTFFTWKYNQLISWGADDKKERWRESTEMKLTGINSMGLEKKNKTGTTPHSWCFKVGHSVIHSHPKRQCDEPGRLSGNSRTAGRSVNVSGPVIRASRYSVIPKNKRTFGVNSSPGSVSYQL